jgi:hypothetical protein
MEELMLGQSDRVASAGRGRPRRRPRTCRYELIDDPPTPCRLPAHFESFQPSSMRTDVSQSQTNSPQFATAGLAQEPLFARKRLIRRRRW